MIVKSKEALRVKCDPVSILEAQNIIKKLEQELQISPTPGIGLAAPQIGVNKQVCVLKGKAPISLVNPKIINQYDLAEFDNEGCLSFPDTWITTKRYAEIFVKDDLHPAGIIFAGLEAVVAQHEIGHLNGELMFDYQIKRPGRNERCWCGSGKKYKSCHIKQVIK